jgi:hypothetical protein
LVSINFLNMVYKHCLPVSDCYFSFPLRTIFQLNKLSDHLIGKRYKEEKKEQARPKIEINVGTVHTLPNEGKHTVQKIAEKKYYG